MTKTDLIDVIAKEVGLPKKKVAELVNTTLGAITNELEKGGKVSLVGFGTFEVVRREKHMGVNPQTKEPIEIPAKNIPKFRPGKALKESVNK